ncbi:MAG: hypothetical protein KDC37_01015 [Flavobacteriales bacterium]|nr:hypothetical protein [Flavobacteriales bacterium]
MGRFKLEVNAVKTGWDKTSLCAPTPYGCGKIAVFISLRSLRTLRPHPLRVRQVCGKNFSVS